MKTLILLLFPIVMFGQNKGKIVTLFNENNPNPNLLFDYNSH